MLLCVKVSANTFTYSICTHTGSPLTPYNRREKIITALITSVALYHTIPQGSHWMKHYTSHYVLIICRPHPLFSICLSSQYLFFHPLLSLSFLLKTCLATSYKTRQLIESKNGRLGSDFSRLLKPSSSIVLDSPLEMVIRTGISLIRRFNKAEHLQWLGGSNSWVWWKRRDSHSRP